MSRVLTDWTPALDARIAELYAKGYSAAAIGADLGFTRNAVIGRMYKLRQRGAVTVRSEAATITLGAPPKPRPAAPPRAPTAKLKRARDSLASRAGAGLIQAVAAAPEQRPAVVQSAALSERFAEGYLGQTGRVSLVELELGHCRFPIDQAEGPVRFCGAAAEPDTSWCRHHAARVMTPVPARRTA